MTDTAICPKCRTEMVHAAVTQHPVMRNMQRTTFVCYTCKQTRTYMLPAEGSGADSGVPNLAGASR